MQWTVEQVARALAVPPPAGLAPLARLAGVSIDSRTVGAGELFYAVHGPRHDGHDFVAAALAAGAAAAVVADERLGRYPAEVAARCFAVADTLVALQQLARAVRREWGAGGGRLGAVTGSVGKTTTKEILAALVASRFRVLKSAGNLNNEFGLPLTLFGLEPEHQAAVVELGMSRRGELARLAAIAEPELALVTNVAPVHLEFFASVEEIALAKRELVEGLAGKDSVAVLNADDPRVASFAAVAPGRVVTFGADAPADFRAEKIEERGAEGSAFDFVFPGGRTRLTLPLVGRHNVLNALAALAAASAWGVTADDAERVFPSLAPAKMRGEVLRFDEGFAVLNDCYNSSPVALAAMVELLAAMPVRGGGRRIVVAGEMLELGAEAAALHREAGRHAARCGADWVIGVQGHAVEIVAGAMQAGLAEQRTQFFESSEDAAHFVAGLATRGDLLLVKGSRGVKMERIVEMLLEKHAVAAAGKGGSG
jgi:UDP-N-acetylmuramoyl-tripeptide--D-alanyl-D-alanine ligase